VWAPTATESLGSNRYMVDLVDDMTRWTETVPIRLKSQAFDEYKKLEASVKTHYSRNIKYLRTDQGGEFTGREFSQHLDKMGIKRELTVHDMQEQVGVLGR
jgi:hypothetical protein